VKRKAAVAGLVSEGLALVSGSAGAGSSTVVVPTPMDPLEFRKSTRDLKALSAAKEHTNEERGGGRDPGVRRPGAGRGQLPFKSALFIWFRLIYVSSIAIRIRFFSDGFSNSLLTPMLCLQQFFVFSIL